MLYTCNFINGQRNSPSYIVTIEIDSFENKNATYLKEQKNSMFNSSYNDIKMYTFLNVYLYFTFFRVHKNDAVAVDYLCTKLLKESIVYHQPKNE